MPPKPLVQMCVLAGCDFVGSLPGIGIKKAHQHLRRTRCFLKVGTPVAEVCWMPSLSCTACMQPFGPGPEQFVRQPACASWAAARASPAAQVVRSLRFDGTKIPPGYECRVQRALWTFKHQRVYCPQRKAVVHLNEIPGSNLAAGALVPEAAQVGRRDMSLLWQHHHACL